MKAYFNLSLVTIFCFLLGQGEASALDFGVKKEGVPTSWDHIRNCLPDLKTAALSEKGLKLSQLKEAIDRTYISKREEETYHLWVLVDSEGRKKRLTLKQVKNSGRIEKELRLEKIDKDGAGEIVAIPADHRVNPSQAVVNKYLYDSEIKEEVTEKIDTKLNGAIVKTRREREAISLLEYSKDAGKLLLKCNHRKEAGDICVCQKK